MKSDELESFTAETFGDGKCEVYDADEVDAAIAELKAKLDELSFDKKLLEGYWKDEKIGREVASRNCIELRNENSKLLSKIESLKVGHRQGIANIKSYYRAKLEDVQATAYTESVDAGMKTLTLPLKKQWFDMIKAGVKKEEYRECSEYWIARFQKLCSYFEYFHAAPHNNVMQSCSGLNVDRLVFTLGYPKADDTERRLTFKNPKIRIGTGKPEWGAEPDKLYFVITWDN